MRLAIAAIVVPWLLSAVAPVARAGMALTADGASTGFGLSTFVTGFPVANGVGPIGIAFAQNGTVLVADYAGDVLIFPSDTDGQSAASAKVGQSYGFANATGMAQISGHIYMNQATNSAVVELNSDGSLRQTIVNVSNPVNNNLTGMAVDPANQHLFVSVPTTIGSFNEILDIDPATRTSSVFETGTFTDGLAFSPDGSVLYAATSSDSVTGFRTSDGAVVLGPVSISGGPDGVAIGTGTLAGNLFVNTNAGQIIDLNLSTLTQTVIASGGSRGDLLYADPTNGSLLVTQTDSILRLTPPPGGEFSSAVAEPSGITLWLLGGSLALLIRGGRRLLGAHRDVLPTFNGHS